MNIRKYFYVLFSSLSVLFFSCTRDFRQMFADRIDFIPKFKFKLFPEEKDKAILSKRVPLIFNIKFNDAYNNNKSNKPASPHRWESWEVDPNAIYFKIKNIRIDGGSGKLFKRIEGSDQLGEVLKKGDKIKHGDTSLWYVPNLNESCYKHKISIDALPLTVDFEREAGEFVTCSVILDEPDYAINLTTDSEVAYVKKKEGTPIELTIKSDNPLAELQKYKIIKTSISEGQGKLYMECSDGTQRPICSNETVEFGVNKLFYKPSLQEGSEEENHTIHLTIGNVQGYKTQDSKMSIKVKDYKYEINLTTDADISYVKNKEGTPIELTINSDNPYDDPEEYKILTSCITGGKGEIIYEDLDGIKKPLCSNTIIKSGTHKLFYKPSLQKGSEEEDHTIHLTVGNVQGYKLQDLSISIKVLDHKVCEYKAEMKIDTENKLLLPYRESACTLTITPLDKESKETEYKVHSISLGGGKFILNGEELREGMPLKSGENNLIFRPLFHAGDIFPKIVITNIKGDKRYVRFVDQFVVSNPIFRVQASIEERIIKLHIESTIRDISGKPVLRSVFLEGGIQGTFTMLSGEEIGSSKILEWGENSFTFKLNNINSFINDINGSPRIRLDIGFPDNSIINTASVDLSIFLLEAIASKIAFYENEGKELYKPLVERYDTSSEPFIQKLGDKLPNWNSDHSKLRDILVYMQNDTRVSPRAIETLTNLQTVKDETKGRVSTRVLTTKLLNNWYKEMSGIHSSQDPDECRIRTEILENEVERFTDTFRSCQNIPGMEDINRELDIVLEKIEDLKRETLEKQAVKDRAKDEYRSFKESTRSAIEQERETRQNENYRLERDINNQDRRLRDEISELKRYINIAEGNIRYLNEQREELERMIRNHDGDIEKLTEMVDELKSRIEKESKRISNAWSRIYAVEDEVEKDYYYLSTYKQDAPKYEPRGMFDD